MTFGSTAIIFAFGFFFRLNPVLVTPEHPLQLAVKAVAVTLNVLTTVGSFFSDFSSSFFVVVAASAEIFNTCFTYLHSNV